MAANYKIVVFNKAGQAMGNILALCQNLQWSKTRNAAETLSFTLDLKRYEQYLDEIGLGDNPFEFLEVGRNDIKIWRNGEWLLCTNVIKFGYGSADPTISMTVQATGTLNYYKKRYADIDYDQIAQEEILWGVIEACNAMAGGDYGVTQGVHLGGTVLRDRHQVRKEVKSFFEQMSQVIGGCDFEFDAEKRLNTFQAQGQYRPDVRLVYPGNIQSFSFDRSVEKVANFIYGVGSGNGEDAVQATSEGTESETYLYRREQIATYNSVVEESTLQENVDAVRYYGDMPIELPVLTVQDGVLDYSTLSVGDTIPVQMNGNKSLAHINGNYRIESITVDVDENGSETGHLTFDDIDVAAIIAIQDAQQEV
jgi:hypothetical protein